ncbi:MAG: hypothetical protein WCS52_05940 [bacterium]
MGGWWEGAWRAPSLLAYIGMLFILGRAAWHVSREWGGYTAYWHLDTRNQEKNKELARHDLCHQVTDFAHKTGVDIKGARPVSDLNQSLLTTLRCTRPIGQNQLRGELDKGNAVLLPLPKEAKSNEAWLVVVSSDRVTEAGRGYGLLYRK